MASVLNTSKLPVETIDLYVPNLQELAEIIQTALEKNFRFTEVKVLQKSPDLTKSPYFLSAPGFGKGPEGPPITIVDIGGPPFLLPLVDRTRIYSLKDIAKNILGYENSEAFLVGAGAGPWPRIGTNCEGIYDVFLARDGSITKNSSATSKILVESGSQKVEKVPEDDTQCALLANILCTPGKAGNPALEIICKGRIGPDDPNTVIRKALASKYGPENQKVGLGGTLAITNGKIKIHVMPDFSKNEITNDDGVNSWLKFFEVPPPFCTVGTLVSGDFDLDLRPQHFHGKSPDFQYGGHYHYDVTPDDVIYQGIFVPAEKLVRVDRPKNTHKVGRD